MVAWHAILNCGMIGSAAGILSIIGPTDEFDKLSRDKAPFSPLFTILKSHL